MLLVMKEKTLFIYPDAGLGNRLNCLYSGIYWSKRLDRRLEILWEMDWACCIRFERLFSTPANVEVKTVYTLPVKGTLHVRSLIGKLYMKRLKNHPSYVSSETTERLFLNGGEGEIEKLLCSPVPHCVKAFGVFAEWEHISEVVNMLKPSPDIEERVSDILCPYDGRRLVGVHIRRTDHRLAMENSPLSLFCSKMEELLSAIPDVCFYLATDDEDVETELSEKFPLVTHRHFSDRKSRRTEAGMKDAYVDMLCLSRCEKIYGSYGSTFSRMASVIGNTSYTVLQKS